MSYVIAVDMESANAITDDNQFLPVTNWIDNYGDDCEDLDASFAVAGPDKDGLWHTIPLDLFEVVPMQ